MNRLVLTFAMALSVTALAACDESKDAPPPATSPSSANSPAANDPNSVLPPFPADSSPDQPRDRRPPPAYSGINSDPNNPNGVPGSTITSGTISRF